MIGLYSPSIDEIKVVNFSLDQLCDTNYPVLPMLGYLASVRLRGLKLLHDAGL